MLNINHQAVLAVSESSTQSGATDVCQVTNISGSKATVDLPDFDAPVAGMETSANVNMEEVNEDMIVEDADEYSAQPWMKPQSSTRQIAQIHPGHGAAGRRGHCEGGSDIPLKRRFLDTWFEKGNGV